MLYRRNTLSCVSCNTLSDSDERMKVKRAEGLTSQPDAGLGGDSTTVILTVAYKAE